MSGLGGKKAHNALSPGFAPSTARRAVKPVASAKVVPTRVAFNPGRRGSLKFPFDASRAVAHHALGKLVQRKARGTAFDADVEHAHPAFERGHFTAGDDGHALVAIQRPVVPAGAVFENDGVAFRMIDEALDRFTAGAAADEQQGGGRE